MNGWAGQDCSYFLAATSAIDSDDEDDALEEGGCVDSCSQHGTCIRGLCRCHPGWSGLSCKVHEQCTTPSKSLATPCIAGVNVCTPGFFGPGCKDEACPHHCWGHGICERGSCRCLQGWSGRICETKAESSMRCDPPCRNGGKCVAGHCICHQGSSGVDCSMSLGNTAEVSFHGETASKQFSSVLQTSQRQTELQNLLAFQHISSQQLPIGTRQQSEPELLGAAIPSEQDAITTLPELQSPSHPTTDGLSAMELKVRRLEAELLSLKNHDQMQNTTETSGLEKEPSGQSLLNARMEKGQTWGHTGTIPAGFVHEIGVVLVQDAPSEAGAPARAGYRAQGASFVAVAPTDKMEQARKAMRVASQAADRLLHTAEQENLEAAKRRVETAVDHAHRNAAGVPGHGGLGEPSTPLEAGSDLVGRLLHEAVPSSGQDLDHEDAFELPNLDASPLAKLPVVKLGAARAKSPPGCEGNCSGHGTCSAPEGAAMCKCNKGWVGMLCDMPRCKDDCHGHGLCVQGGCVCDKAWYGDTCSLQRCPRDCSGAGYCFNGECHCVHGFRGADCSRIHATGQVFTVKMQRGTLLKAPPAINSFRNSATLRALDKVTCPENCNNRGSCSAAGRCHCNTGFSGPACQSYCPNLCSHQGDCIEGACLCFAGFMGVDCSVVGCCNGHGSCDVPGECLCEPGWTGNDCSLRVMCADPTCSGHGTCTNGKCHCSMGFEGPTCALASGMCNPPCGPSGACDPMTKTCTCMQGWTGLQCLTQIKTCPKNCNSRGLCMNGMCMCGAGWMGEDCSKRYFAPGQGAAQLTAAAALQEGALGVAGGALAGKFGAMPPPIAGGAVAGGAVAGGAAGGASAGSPAAAPSGVISVGAGAPGPTIVGVRGAMAITGSMESAGKTAVTRLTATASGTICGEMGMCSGHGVCNSEAGKCVCSAMFTGDACEEQHCPGFLEVGVDCHGHGACQYGKCLCAAGWGTYPGPLGLLVPIDCSQQVCALPCGDHGSCVNGECVCVQGWTGPNCRDPECPVDCSGHGKCGLVSSNSPGECTCDYGWAGASCNRVALYSQLRSCANDCFGNGLCMDGKCLCNVGFGGVDCSRNICDAASVGPECELQRCPNDCHGQGLCMDGHCSCWEAFTGSDCSVPVTCYHGCHDACEADATTSRCVFCVGQCLTVPSKSAYGLGEHNSLDDLRSTFLQAPSNLISSISMTKKLTHPRHPHTQVHSPRASLPHSGKDNTLAQTLSTNVSRRTRKHKEVSAIQLQRRSHQESTNNADSRGSRDTHEQRHHPEIQTLRLPQ